MLLALAYLCLTACKKKVQANYEKALSEGSVLVENDTTEVDLQKSILFDFSFADGVNPMHYAWEIYQHDSLILHYLNTEDFHFAAPDIVGGPAAAIHSYKVLKTGVHKLVFYNPFYNQEQLRKEQEGEDIYLIWTALKEDFSAYDTLVDWTRSTFESHWMALQAAEGASKDSLWQVVRKATYTIDSIPDSTTLQALLVNWSEEYTSFTSQETTLELLDTLLGATDALTRVTWHDLRQQQDKQPPLHTGSNPKIYYVRVSPK